jgi:ABC-type polar amino acid transport system ATPase subunit
MGGNSSKEAEKPVRTQSFAVPNKISKKYKKAIVVIGKMASGKSSFVKMLTHPEDKSKIKIKTSNKSVTVECSLYRVDPTLKLFS